MTLPDDPTPAAEPKPVVALKPVVDPSLAMLVRKVSSKGVRITLIVRGVAISGELIDAHDYYQALQNAHIAGDGAGVIRKEFSKLHHAICPSHSKDKTVAAVAAAAPYYHLRDATVAGMPVGLWRGRLSAVDGYALSLETK